MNKATGTAGLKNAGVFCGAEHETQPASADPPLNLVNSPAFGQKS